MGQEEELSAFKDAKAEQEKVISDLREKIAELENLCGEIDVHKKKCEELEDTVLASNIQIDEHKEKNCALEETLSVKHVEIEDHKSKAEVYEEHIHKLENKYEKLKEKYEKYKSEEDAEDEEQEEELSAFKSAKDEQEKVISDLREKIVELENLCGEID